MTKKLIAVLNKKIPVGKIMNALAHMALGLGASVEKEKLKFVTYIDASSEIHDAISYFPFIILEADNSSQIRSLRERVKEANLIHTTFTDTMTVGTTEEQIEKTEKTQEQDLEYYGLAFFGEKEEIQLLTKKFSLWR